MAEVDEFQIQGIIPQYTPPAPFNSGVRGGVSIPNNTPVLNPQGQTVSPPGYDDFTTICNPVYVREQHLTVIRRGPTMPPNLEMSSWNEEEDVNNMGGVVLEDDFYDINMSKRLDPPITGVAIDNLPNDGSTTPVSCFYTANKELKKIGDEILLHAPSPYLQSSEGLDIEEGYKVIIKHNFTNSLGILQTASVRGVILQVNNVMGARIKLTSTPFNFPLTLSSNQIYTISVIKKDPIFEYKFPKFAYRYRYEDGEYSVFSPWSEIAFIPGKFDYLPKKGYNLGMVNNLRSLKILDWRPKNIPKDVVEIDLLYKESNSPNVYTVETFEITDSDTDPWNLRGTGDHYGNYTVTSELIHKVVPSNQMLRPWDNVPRVALGQEITANRLIYANYLQNYDLLDVKKENYIKVAFNISLKDDVDYSITGANYEPNALTLSQSGAVNQPMYPMKSLKSMRTYQLGVVYRDRYGRETPVLTSKSGSIKVPKTSAKLQSRLEVAISSEAPDWAESYTFYVKETSNEYYNLSMDRWYNAEDGGMWLSFPSSERNKLNEESIIILKKQHGNHKPVETSVKYKVLDIKNDAPSFIKEELQYWGVVPMMLPPPGWGVGGSAGGWDSGMFHPTGLPLPNRLYLDIYAEYFDQSVLAGLTSKDNAEVRMVQSSSSPSSYNAWSSDSINKSNWYGVANVNYIGSPAETYTETTTVNNVEVEQEIEIPGQAEQLVRISLEKLMGQDMAFCEPKDDLSLSRGLSLEARTKTRRNKAQFEGRFFVKINRDPDAEVNIIEPQNKIREQYQVLMAKEIKYLCFAHPGVQDWRTDESGTVGGAQTTMGRWYKGDRQTEYLPSISLNYLPPAADPAADPNHQISHDTPFQYLKREVSSFSSTVGNAPFTGAFPLHQNNNGGNISPTSVQGYPPYPYNWPIGPGWHASFVYEPGSPFPEYANTYNNYAYGSPGPPNFIPKWPPAAESNWGWPSFGPDHWGPNTTSEVAWGDGGSNDQVQGDWPNFVGGSQGVPNIQKGAQWNAGLYITFHSATMGNPTFMNQVPPANPYQVPAIWGNQGDFFDNTALDTDAAPLASGVSNNQNKSVWSKGTIEELRENWRFLWEGRNLVSSTWPPGHASTERWFFDKVGAAKGYSGNGIWEESIGGQTVTKMHVSFYGIGNKAYRHRSHEMLTHQENEVAFAEALSTLGTQFRFRADPDQVVYTVTGVGEPELIYNYESVRGTWGWQEDGSTPLGGSGIGSGKLSPFGPTYMGGQGGVAGKQAFISDVYTEYSQAFETLTGGSPYNYRTRYTITLDKVIGDANNGSNMFHPLKKHVDEDGNCNIEMGPKVYWSGNQGAAPSHWKGGYYPTEENGGTINPVAFYNLSSYWNQTTAANLNSTGPTNGQSKLAGTGDIDGQHFGLHEAGLNGTWMEIVTPYRGDDIVDTMTNNPAVWETEPKEDVGLDIYYAASPTYPIKVKRWRSDRLIPDPIDTHWNSNPVHDETGAYYHDYGWRGEEVIPVGAKAELITPIGPNVSANIANVVAVQGETIWFDNNLSSQGGNASLLMQNDIVRISWDGDGAFYGAETDLMYIDVRVTEGINIFTIKVHNNLHTYIKHILPYFNCYTFSNGVESNRIRDDFNAVTIDKGVKASMPLAEKYMEERRGSSLIFSGIYNSTSGINRTNQFIQAEPITKEINPVNGSIQKLFARDTDLITFCENKVFKILANKDALFNASGNTNLTATNKVLGQSVPFVGEYGISRNPESLASESYRLYFSDKTRGAVLRLSRDGLTPISEKGMKDWFKDNFREASSIVGSYDDSKGHYNLTVTSNSSISSTGKIEVHTLSYSERKKGWESFKSFCHDGGISHKNIYYTVPSNFAYADLDEQQDPWGEQYKIDDASFAQLYQHNLNMITKRFASLPAQTTNILQFSDVLEGDFVLGMNIEGNGIPYGTFVKRIDYTSRKITLSNNVNISIEDELTLTMPRNLFYSPPAYYPHIEPLNPHYSMLKVLFNGDPGSIKRYKTLNYEGDQAYTPKDATNEWELHDGLGTTVTFDKYIDNWEKDGWFVENLFTDMQKGTLNEFLNKENKWYNYIRGYSDAGAGDDLDTSEFSAQGLGFVNHVIPSP